MVKKLHHKNTQQYKKPALTKKKLVLNQFAVSSYFDEEDFLVSSYLLASGSPCCCILPDTKIRMYDGSEKEAQALRVGDRVLSYNLLTDNFEKGIVRNLFSQLDGEGYFIINQKLKVTPEHPIWVQNKGWVEAKRLHVGDRILNSKAEEIKISSLQKIEQAVPVYNLSIGSMESDVETYFIEDCLTVTYANVQIQMHSFPNKTSPVSLLAV